MIFTIFFLATALVGFKYPGVLLAGLFMGYGFGALAETPQLTTYYTILSLCVLSLRLVVLGHRIYVTILDIAFAAFASWYVLSAAWMPDAAAAQAAVVAFANPMISIYLGARLVGNQGEPEKRIQETLVGFCVFGVIMAPLLIGSGFLHNGRLFVGTANPVGLALPQPYILLSGIALMTVMQGRKTLSFIIGALAVVSAVTIANATGTRGSVVAIAGGLVVLYAFVRNKFQVAIIAAATCAVAVLLLYLFFPETDFDSLLSRLLDFETYGSALDPSSLQRLDRYTLTWDLINTAPVFGVGIGGFSALTGFDYPHNLFLEIAVQSGAIGLVLFLCLAAAFILRSQAVGLFSRWQGQVFLSIVAMGLLHQQVSYDLPSAKWLFMIGFCAGVPRLLAKKEPETLRHVPPKLATVSREGHV